MAIKKSELYSSLWKSCDQLRGGMDASQYKDYILVLLFIKYISDKYSNTPYAPIIVPEGASFKDMVALKGATTIGDDINKKIIAPISEQNGLTILTDFNDAEKLGKGADMVKKLTNLISIFENPALDFKKNRVDGDDIIGDAYEYLMRNFATESGKSKGQFYTPAEVSRVIAKVIGIDSKNVTASTSIYDPACGSGSLLLKLADEAETPLTVYGQEMDNATASLARMNMILHNNPTAVIMQGNTLSEPLFKDTSGRLERFDYVVANPPFSYKSWSNGVNIDMELEAEGRFYNYGVPPSKNGDYAFLLHILKSMKPAGKGVVVLPHGVLFRGNAEGEIRKKLIKNGVIKGIIGLPANLFYGTGIPACLIVLDKENTQARKGIFFIDASKGFVKDGNKNRLREEDIHKIVDVFDKSIEIEKYSRVVPLTEIEENEYNLNIPRYIDGSEPEDIQNLEAHLLGGIPEDDINTLKNYWDVFPNLKTHLFDKSKRAGFLALKVAKEEIKKEVNSHSEFITFSEGVTATFEKWQKEQEAVLKGINDDTKPKKLIQVISENLLTDFAKLKLIDKYDAYQQLMMYWNEKMQDDCHLIISDKWEVGKEVEEEKKTFEGKLLPKSLLTEVYFATENSKIIELESERDSIAGQIAELEEEHSGDEGLFADFDKVNKASVQKRLNEIKPKKKVSVSIAAEAGVNYDTGIDELEVLQNYIKLCDDLADKNGELKINIAELEAKLREKYKTLNVDEIKYLTVNKKWMKAVKISIENEVQIISQALTQRIIELAERYENPLPSIQNEVNELEQKVSEHLREMGLMWN